MHIRDYTITLSIFANGWTFSIGIALFLPEQSGIVSSVPTDPLTNETNFGTGLKGPYPY